LFDGDAFTGDGVTVLVDDGRIAGVEPGFPDVGERWEVVEFEDATVLPGLIDTHVHLVTDSADRALDRVAGYSEQELADVMSDGLRRHLAAGVTTVRDLGDRGFAVADRRPPVGGPVTEPTILASGPPLTSPGGHCFFMGGEVANRAAMAGAIRERVERGVDIVKIMASGGMTTPGTDVMRTQFTDDDLRFLVDQAHAAGLPVTAHAHGLPAVEQALAARVDGMEHCSCLTDTGIRITDEVLKTLADRQIPIGAALGVPPAALFANAPPAIKQMMERTGTTPDMVRAGRLDAVGRMYRAGVQFVGGADSGISSWRAHGLMRNSVSFLVEAGASTADAVAAATSKAAQACNIADRKGRIRMGFDADLLVVGGDLSNDIRQLSDIRTVLVGGRRATWGRSGSSMQA